MKSFSNFIKSIGLNHNNRIEPSILWNLESYPISHFPMIIQVKKGVEHSIERTFKRLGCRDIEYFSIINSFYSKVPIKHIKKILNLPAITYMSANHRVYSCMDEVTDKIGSSQVNQFGYTGRNVVIAHLDTGIHPHGDLSRPKNRIIYFKDFIHNLSRAYDDHGHGTFGAGCMAGNGIMSKGQYKGIAPDALLIGLKCLDQSGSGETKSVLQALQWVLENKEKHNIQILHLPFGVDYPYPVVWDPLVEAVNTLWDENITVVCAAGNNGPHQSTILSPGTSEKVITVGGSKKTARPGMEDGLCDFSSRGPTLANGTKPDLVAPARQIISLNFNTKFHPYLSFSGTSASSAIVTGAIALLLEKHPQFTPEEVKLAIEMSCDSLHVDKNIQGKGILNIEKLLSNEFK
ncbi:S8 family peptidase [Irregularibacter muris]|uniref:S8 family peptidase n=1 Tax=Irregularibacter muris TaxID=1796619 RepID=A0AAE3KZW5_9FIRM|nr:S8 family peptidase [Irregularibacter muris]MCR1899281.1 S8 family peptidase [Irregularibacter muris]